MTHSIEEMVRECEAHARIEDYWASANPAGSTLHIERTAAAARLRAAAKALRLLQSGIDPSECDDGTYQAGWHLGWIMGLAELRKRAATPPLAAAVVGAGEGDEL